MKPKSETGRARAAAPCCQVKDCTNPLPEDKQYYRRYRICAVHATVTSIMIEGRRQRFCQLCGKFHDTTAFDGQNRSCRARLLRHYACRNARLKKAPPLASSPDESSEPTTNSGSDVGMSPRSARATGGSRSRSHEQERGMEESSESEDAPPPRQRRRQRRQPVERAPAAQQALGQGSLGGLSGASGSTGHGGGSVEGMAGLEAVTGSVPGEEPAAQGRAGAPQLAQHAPDPELQAILSWLPPMAAFGGTLASSAASLPAPGSTPGGDVGPPGAALNASLQPSLAGRLSASLPVMNTWGGQLHHVTQHNSTTSTAELVQGFSWQQHQPVQLGLPPQGPPPGLQGVGLGPGEKPAPKAGSAELLPHLLPLGTSLDELDMQGQQQHATLGSVYWGLSQAGQAPPGQGGLGVQGLVGLGSPPSAAGALQHHGGGLRSPPGIPRPPQQQLQQQPAPPALLGREQHQQQQSGPSQSSSPSPQDSGPAYPTVKLAPQAAASSPFEEQDATVRLSIKMFGVHPDELPPSLLEDIKGMVSADPVFMEAFVRSGCTHVTVAAVVGAADRDRLHAAGAQGLARLLLQRGGWGAGGGAGEAWAADMLVQVLHEVAVVEEGQLVGVREARPDLPTLLAAWPPAVLAGGRACGAAAADGSPDAALDSSSLGGEALGLGSASEEDVVSLWGVNICGPDDRVLCRQAGRFLPVEILGAGALPYSVVPPGDDEPAPLEWVLLRPLGAAPGLLEIEVEREGLLSAAAPVTALPSRQALVEALDAQRVVGGQPHQLGYLVRLGWVLSDHHRQQETPPQQGSPGIAGPPPPQELGASSGSLSPRHSHASLAVLGLLAAAISHGWGELVALLSPALGLRNSPARHSGSHDAAATPLCCAAPAASAAVTAPARGCAAHAQEGAPAAAAGAAGCVEPKAAGPLSSGNLSIGLPPVPPTADVGASRWSADSDTPMSSCQLSLTEFSASPGEPSLPGGSPPAAGPPPHPISRTTAEPGRSSAAAGAEPAPAAAAAAARAPTASSAAAARWRQEFAVLQRRLAELGLRGEGSTQAARP